MEDSELNKKVLNCIESFDSLESLNPSEEWSKRLKSRLETVKPYKSSVFSPSKFTVAIFLIAILNIGIILTAIFNDSRHSLSRGSALEIISKEMLVNPNSLNK